MIEDENYQWQLRNAITDKNLWKIAALMFLTTMVAMLIISIYRTETEMPLKAEIEKLKLEKGVLIEAKQCQGK